MSTRQVLSVNVSGPRWLSYRGESVKTGIFKTPEKSRVKVHQLYLEGDVQVDKRYHGGPDKAVYVYPHEHYAHWEQFLNRHDFQYGEFGENLTTTGLLETEVRTGDVLRIGSAVLQVTTPRVPCYKLMAKMHDFTFAKPFLVSGRTGFYLRVLEEGEIGAGDPIKLVSSDPSQPTIHELSRLKIKD